MNPEQSPSVGSFDERFIDLFNESLVSTHPVLIPAAAEKIGEIRATRLAQLAGEERFQAEGFFDYLEIVPPLEALRLEYIFKPLAETDCSNPKILEVTQAVFSPRQTVAEEKSPPELERNEWGYLNGRARLKSVRLVSQEGIESSEPAPALPEFLPVSLDEQKSIREGKSVLTGLYRHLLALEDHSLRQSLVKDCLEILRLRTHIFLPFDGAPLQP